MGKSFVLGIDLGTSNSALAMTTLPEASPEVLHVTQIAAPNRLEEKQGLPSALYVGASGEFAEGALQLPWQNESPTWVVGAFAREHGAQVTDRLVTSAKSWLSNPHTDPRKAVLPWASTIPDEGKVSAVEASTHYLAHLRNAFEHQYPGHALDEAVIIITVPASFHEAARNLTLEAAESAGFPEVVLLEEPQAAFYSWVHQTGDDWRNQVSPGDIVLVCDVGGGTSDFSLIAVTEDEGALNLERLSVGEHLLLGGDNMDLALAYIAQGQLTDAGHEIDDWQLWALVHACRQAKVTFFNDDTLTEIPIAVPSRGSSLLAGAVSTTLSRESVESMIIDGFFPLTEATDLPSEETAGLQEMGLPYASDPVISKHLAQFLQRGLQNLESNPEWQGLLSEREDRSRDGLLLPDGVLFNGGVLNAAPIRRRVLNLLEIWAGRPVRELEGAQPDLAVARGAAHYGAIRESGSGVRIQAGIPRSYYVGLESSMPAVPGFRPPVKALCVVPQGMAEGSDHLIEDQEFGLVIGQPAEFRFFSSSVRSADAAGETISNAEKALEENACLNVTLPAMEGYAEGDRIPVRVHAVVTEVGNLELWMEHAPTGERWKFELELRG